MKNLKTVHITNYYHKNSGGISTSYNKLMEAAERRQREMCLIVPGAQNAVEKINDFAKIYYVQADFSPVFDKRYRLLLPWKTYLKSGQPIREILLAEKPDLIEVAEKYSLSLIGGMIRTGHFRQLGRPLLVHFSCERMDDNIKSFLSKGRAAKWFARRFMSHYVLPMFDFHIANSPYTAQEFYDALESAKNSSKWFFNYAWQNLRAAEVPINRRIFANPRGVDTSRYNRELRSRHFQEALKHELNLPADAALLLYAGRISPEKNLEILPKVMQILARDTARKYYLIIAGGGPSEESLKAQFEEFAPNRARFVGHLTNKEELAVLYANADVFIHPNPREPFGIAPLEGMASGAPVVVFRSGGLLSYAGDENVWFAEFDESEEFQTAQFAQAIQSVFQDSEQTRQKKIASALETTHRFSWEASTDKLFSLYDRFHAEFTANKNAFGSFEKPSTDYYSRFLLSTQTESAVLTANAEPIPLI